jgi:hypothetical protein
LPASPQQEITVPHPKDKTKMTGDTHLPDESELDTESEFNTREAQDATPRAEGQGESKNKDAATSNGKARDSGKEAKGSGKR